MGGLVKIALKAGEKIRQIDVVHPFTQDTGSWMVDIIKTVKEIIL